jgi:hypothetical protein
LVDQDGTLIAKRRIGESVEDFAELLTLLAEAGDSVEEPIPVAIETSRGLLVAALRATGRAIYAINRCCCVDRSGRGWPVWLGS